MPKKLKEIYKGKKVLVTGHTGFKGTWLTIWLTKLGADVAGFSLPELPTDPSNFDLSKVTEKIKDYRGDVRNIDELKKVIDKHKPELIFHLAAQPILLRSYDEPRLTFETNAMGTVNMLECVKESESVKAVVSITTDKVYKNNEWVWGYREHDQIGDTDPYAASKAMAEHAIESYRKSFFIEGGLGDKRVALAAARAGNVIGGGDFADFRIIPDCIRALMSDKPIEIRSPDSVRPWQLVLEPLSGYLVLGAKLLEEPNGGFDRAWNFGPLSTKGVKVKEIADIMVNMWEKGEWKDVSKPGPKKESTLLMLDWTAALNYLNWRPVYDYKETIEELVSWFKEYAKQKDENEKNIDMYKTCSNHIDKYVKRAKELEIDWAID
ncbi:CDP-glucose 4,6-dehydratase [Patescibacteria group bacterium]